MTKSLLIKALATGSMVAAIVGAAAVSTGIAASAQSVAQQSPAQDEITTPRLNLTLEQRHVIKELIKDLKIEPAATPARSGVGETVPQDANLQPMPSDIGRKVPQIRAHRFMYTAESILIVDPKDNKVAEVIELREEH